MASNRQPGAAEEKADDVLAQTDPAQYALDTLNKQFLDVQSKLAKAREWGTEDWFEDIPAVCKVLFCCCCFPCCLYATWYTHQIKSGLKENSENLQPTADEITSLQTLTQEFEKIQKKQTALDGAQSGAMFAKNPAVNANTSAKETVDAIQTALMGPTIRIHRKTLMSISGTVCEKHGMSTDQQRIALLAQL